MAIHCDVCGTVLLGAYENEGGFPTPDGFISKSPYPRNSIENTCTPCGSTITNEIKNTIKNVVERLRNK
jgi:hypothetical protein